MKTLKELFGKKEIKKSLNNFTKQLDLGSMMIIKGGDNDDDDQWPDETSGKN